MSKRTEATHDEGQFNKYYHVLPNMYDDDLNPYEYRLIGHYKRVGISWEGTRKIAKTCQMSVGMVTKARKSLEAKGLIRIEMLTRAELKERGLVNDPKPEAKTKICVTSVVDVSEQNYKRYRNLKQPVHYANTDPVHHMNTPVHGMNTPVHQVNERNNTVEEITIEEKESANADKSTTPSKKTREVATSHSNSGKVGVKNPTPPNGAKPPSPQKAKQNALHAALLTSFNLKAEHLTRSENGKYWTAAAELVRIDFPPERVHELYWYIRRKADVEGWKTWTVMALVSRAGEFIRDNPTNITVLTQPDPLPIAAGAEDVHDYSVQGKEMMAQLIAMKRGKK